MMGPVHVDVTLAPHSGEGNHVVIDGVDITDKVAAIRIEAQGGGGQAKVTVELVPAVVHVNGEMHLTVDIPKFGDVDGERVSTTGLNPDDIRVGTYTNHVDPPAVRVTHLPTGHTVTNTDTPSALTNRARALAELRRLVEGG